MDPSLGHELFLEVRHRRPPTGGTPSPPFPPLVFLNSFLDPFTGKRTDIRSYAFIAFDSSRAPTFFPTGLSPGISATAELICFFEAHSIKRLIVSARTAFDVPDPKGWRPE